LRTCKAPGCDRLARKRSGPYALLCKAHVEEKRAARLGAASNGAGPREEASSRLVVPADGFGAQAAEFVDMARQLDEALAELEEPLRRSREGLQHLQELALLPPAAANGLLTNG
jgi:hypothetical protein